MAQLPGRLLQHGLHRLPVDARDALRAADDARIVAQQDRGLVVPILERLPVTALQVQQLPLNRLFHPPPPSEKLIS